MKVIQGMGIMAMPHISAESGKERINVFSFFLPLADTMGCKGMSETVQIWLPCSGCPYSRTITAVFEQVLMYAL